MGTRCFVALLSGKADLDPLLLQAKEAQPSVLAPYVGRSHTPTRASVLWSASASCRQPAMCSWGGPVRIRHALSRQLRDMKGSVPLDDESPNGQALYGRLCGAALGRLVRPRAGQPALLAGYLGKSTAFDDSLGRFGRHTPTRTTGITKSFLVSIRSGRVPAEPGR